MEQRVAWLARAGAFLTFGLLMAIVGFIFAAALPALLAVGPGGLLGWVWHPPAGHFGLLPMVLSSAVVVGLAMALAIPLGLALALLLTFLAPQLVRGFFSRLLELLGGVPSVVYGFFGLQLLLDPLRQLWPWLGRPLWVAIPLLALMVLPTFVRLAQEALVQVPRDLFLGALALGASRLQAAWGVALPAARLGVASAAVLALGRALGETMVVLMLTSKAPLLELPLTAHIAFEMKYALGVHRSALFASGLLLLLAVLGLNLWLARLGDRHATGR